MSKARKRVRTIQYNRQPRILKIPKEVEKPTIKGKMVNGSWCMN